MVTSIDSTLKRYRLQIIASRGVAHCAVGFVSQNRMSSGRNKDGKAEKGRASVKSPPPTLVDLGIALCVDLEPLFKPPIYRYRS